jgi:hypothetical protein
MAARCDAEPSAQPADSPFTELQSLSRLTTPQATLDDRRDDLESIKLSHRHGDGSSRVHRRRSLRGWRSTYMPKHDIFI